MKDNIEYNKGYIEGKKNKIKNIDIDNINFNWYYGYYEGCIDAAFIAGITLNNEYLLFNIEYLNTSVLFDIYMYGYHLTNNYYNIEFFSIKNSIFLVDDIEIDFFFINKN